MRKGLNEVQCPVALEATNQPDLLFLFACRLAWLREQDRKALERLWAAADSTEPQTHAIAHCLLNGIETPAKRPR